ATVTSRGTVISFAETATGLANVVPFASGSAELTPGFRGFLDSVAPILAGLTNKVEVQGHTDKRPIHTPAYPSNWELSAARAGSVVRYFVGSHGLGAHMFVCSGFADTVPADPSDTPDAWAHNRRIEIVVTRNPAAVYDSLTRDQVASQEVDITQPLGPKMFDIPMPLGGQPVPVEPLATAPDPDAVTKAAHPGADQAVHEPATEPVKAH
ncbi:MAG: OmpA family protein, partial [Armatimonadetes bacterium]|nr:OmpA family protein [Armatimonadota bacterium]